MENIVEWMRNSTLYDFIANNGWVWPTMEIMHFMGLCLLFGSLLFVDLRILGVAKSVDYKSMDRFILLTLIGFAINLITGIGFLFGDPDRYFINSAFQYKMSLILIAGLNAAYFTLRLRSDIKNNGSTVTVGNDAKAIAGLSLCLWASVIVLGRFIPYVENSAR